MLSAIIATHKSELALVRDAGGAGTRRGGRRDQRSGGRRRRLARRHRASGRRRGLSLYDLHRAFGTRLKEAAASTRTPWLMFLRAGCVPQPAWVAAVDRFMQIAETGERADRAAVFRPPGIADLMRPGLAEILAHAAGNLRRRNRNPSKGW